MKPITSALLVLMMICAVMGTACTTTDDGLETPTATPTPQTTTAPPQPTGTEITPGLPPSWKSVNFDVNRDSVFTDIVVSFRGGEGLYVVTDIVVRATLSTGNVVVERLGTKVGDEVTIQGTTGEDRIEIFVSYIDGSTYKVYDRYHTFKKRL